jgi:hypothetical protein
LELAALEFFVGFYQSVLLGLVACIFASLIHKMDICPLLNQKLDCRMVLVFDGHVQDTLPVAVYIVDLGSSYNQPGRHRKVPLKDLMHQNCLAILILGVQFLASKREIVDYFQPLKHACKHKRVMAV